MNSTRSHTESASRSKLTYDQRRRAEELIAPCIDDEDALRRLVYRLYGALYHIAYEPLTDDPEASDRECLDETVRIAREALSDEERNHG